MIQEPEDDRPQRRQHRRERGGAPDRGADARSFERGPSGLGDVPGIDGRSLVWGDPFAPYASQLDPPARGTAIPGAVVSVVPPAGPDVPVTRRPPTSGRGAALLLAVLRPWLDPRPGELRGVIILLVAALSLSLALWFDAARRPASIGVDATDAVPVDLVQDGAHAGMSTDGAVGTRADGAVGRRADGADGWGLGGAGVDGRVADGPVVHVSGAVLVPGIVELDSGARVADAIAAAGGAMPDAQLDRLNLARIVEDGEQVHVTRVGEDAPPPEASASRGVLPDGRIDLNTASATELETLPGVGPARAQAIIAEREVRPFRVPGDLRRVPGIGEVTFQRLAPLVAVR